MHITADTDDNTTVVARSGLKVRDLAHRYDDRRPDLGSRQQGVAVAALRRFAAARPRCPT